jgi:putative spermidine/putrescine transport system ATP-binding protein
MARDAMLELVGINKTFGKTIVARNIELRVAEGEFFSLLGPSGCGKTSLLRMIAGIVSPDTGTVRIAGRDVTQASMGDREAVLVFQNYALFPHMTVSQNISFGLEMRRMARPERERRIAEAIAIVKLQGHEHRKPSQLSGGQQQRVALARAIAVRPRLLLLDEPLSNLDASLRDEMRTQLKEIQRSVGITLVLVTHDIQEAFAVSDRIGVMNRGCLEQVGLPSELYCKPRSSFVGAFCGDANFLEGVVEEQARGGQGLRLDDGSILLTADNAPVTINSRNRVMVRPEDIQINDRAAAGDQEGTVIPVDVEEVTFLGAQAKVKLAWKGGTITILVWRRDIDRSAAISEIFIPRDACVPLSQNN